MVSTELLRRYPFFARLNDGQLRKMAMIGEERTCAPGEVLFTGGAVADQLYLLRKGSVELHYVVKDERGMEKTQDYLVGIINPGEVFGISAVVQPYRYTSSAVAGEACEILALDAMALRAMCDEDIELKALFQERIATTAFKRLQDTRVQLLAA
ncbi:MAG: Crp/Fnr family transcriptional regulator [Candidatus Promineifilaceae bacterium]